MPPALAAVDGLAENVRLQDSAAQRLRTRRHEHGALELETHRGARPASPAARSPAWPPSPATAPRSSSRTS